jgi:hypothetical protein
VKWVLFAAALLLTFDPARRKDQFPMFKDHRMDTGYSRPVFYLHEGAGCSADSKSTPHLAFEMWGTLPFRTVVVALYVPSALWHYEFSGEMNGRDTETVLTMYIA